MKLATNTNEFHVGGIKASKEYRVANTPHMMDILSKLYSNEIQAVIRELTINGLESHFKAGQTRDIDVQLPTHSNPVVRFRDYGTGLSLDSVRDLYTVYGMSDKNHSNDYTGCLGVGSKSPFTYTDSFTVISYYNGMAYTLTNTKNADGRPTCILMSEKETNEPNGLEIYFDVKSKDIYKFSQEAEELFAFYDKMPNVINRDMSDDHYAKVKYYEHENMFISGYDGLYSPCVVMGQIKYKIQFHQLNDEKLKRCCLSEFPLVIDAPIGAVSMTPSREALMYNKVTVEYVEEQLRKYIAFLQGEINDTIANEPCLMDARFKFLELISSREPVPLYNIKNDPNFNLNFKYKDVPVSDTVTLPNLNISQIDRNNNGNAISKTVGKENIRIFNKTDYGFYYTDKRGGVTVCKNAVLAKKHDCIYVLKQKSPDAIKLFKETLGINEVLPASNLGEYVTETRGSTIITGKKFNPNGWRIKNSWNTATEIDLDEDIVYVEIKKYETDALKSLMRSLSSNGINAPNLYGLSKTNFANMPEDSNCVYFMDWLKQTRENFLTPALVKEIENYQKYNDIHRIYKSLVNYKDKIKNPRIQELVDKSSLVKNSTYNKINCVQMLDRWTGEKSPFLNLTTVKDDVINKYPFLDLIEPTRINSKNIEVVLSYINSETAV